MSQAITRRDPDPRGYFGEFGGRYVPETLVAPVEELERSYLAAREDPAFLDELDRLLEHYVGRPTPVSEARRLSAAFRGARCSAWSATCTWAPRTWTGRRSTSFACACLAATCGVSTPAAAR